MWSTASANVGGQTVNDEGAQRSSFVYRDAFRRSVENFEKLSNAKRTDYVRSFRSGQGEQIQQTETDRKEFADG